MHKSAAGDCEVRVSSVASVTSSKSKLQEKHVGLDASETPSKVNGLWRVIEEQGFSQR